MTATACGPSSPGDEPLLDLSTLTSQQQTSSDSSFLLAAKPEYKGKSVLDRRTRNTGGYGRRVSQRMAPGPIITHMVSWRPPRRRRRSGRRRVAQRVAHRGRARREARRGHGAGRWRRRAGRRRREASVVVRIIGRVLVHIVDRLVGKVREAGRVRRWVVRTARRGRRRRRPVVVIVVGIGFGLVGIA